MRCLFAPLVALGMLSSGAAEALEVTFSFEVDRVETSCGGAFGATLLPFCDTADPSGAIVVTVDLADPRADQTWSAPAIVSAPFPTSGAPSAAGSATGSDAYDPITGIGTATLTPYGSYEVWNDPAESWEEITIGTGQWQYRWDNPTYSRIARYVPGVPQVAFAFVAPASIPPAVAWPRAAVRRSSPSRPTSLASSRSRCFAAPRSNASARSLS